MQYNDYFTQIPYLETERFYLTAFAREDMDDYFDILRDDRVQKYLGGGVPLFDKEPHITNWLNNINNRLLNRKLVFTWCVKDKQTGAVAGRIDLGGFVKKTMAELAYHFAYPYWGKGVGTEIVGRVTDFGLNQLGLVRIQALIKVENHASVAVCKKNGYVNEGVLRHYPFGKEFADVVMMAIVKER